MYETRAGWILLAPITIGLLVAGPGVRFARTARWNVLLGAVLLVTVAWAIALGLNDGWRGLTDPLLPDHYVATVRFIGSDPIAFLRSFTSRLASYNIDTQGHPPGMVLILWALDRLGVGGPDPTLALVLAAGASGVIAVLVTVRDVAGETAARAAAPFLVVAPAAIWWSSADALYLGVSAWAVALIVLGTGAVGRRSVVLTVGGGVLFGVTAMLSYGLVLLAVIPLAVAIARHEVRRLGFAAAGAAAVVLLFVPAGFWWLAGLAATRVRYYAGVGGRRPYRYFVVGDLGAFALALGPMAAVGLAILRDRRLFLLVGGALVVVALADLSGLSKAEVERIWVPFVPWVLVATAAIGVRRRVGWVRLALCAQVAVAVGIQAAIHSPW